MKEETQFKLQMNYNFIVPKGSSIFFLSRSIIIALNRIWVGMKHYCNLFYAFLCYSFTVQCAFYEQNKKFCREKQMSELIQSDVSGFTIRNTCQNSILPFQHIKFLSFIDRLLLLFLLTRLTPFIMQNKRNNVTLFCS